MNVLFTYISCLALAMVVCLHLPSFPKHWLLDCAVPWFFLASGYWYSRSSKSFGENVRGRVWSLIVPYYLWNILWFPILFAAHWIGWRYCGMERTVDGSLPCVLRCLGLSPFAWPALVPTWYLRALFVVVVAVGGFECLLRRVCGAMPSRVLTCALFAGASLTQRMWAPEGDAWNGLLTYGIPVYGCAWFAAGILLGGLARRVPDAPQSPVSSFLRHQTMPVYLLHAPVLIACGWVAHALHFHDRLTTLLAGFILWAASILVSVLLGESLRCLAPRAASLLFGHR